jgi:sirohydrochlorin ferrochelatase
MFATGLGGARAQRDAYILEMRSILLIDHGSVREEANHMLVCMANMLQQMVGEDVLVNFAHMELAEPTIAQGFAACVRDGATDIVAFPYMLSPGKHSTRDIPRMVAEAAAEFPHVTYRVTEAFGMSALLAEVVARRSGVDVVHRVADDTCRCWDPLGNVGNCGAACTGRIAHSTGAR